MKKIKDIPEFECPREKIIQQEVHHRPVKVIGSSTRKLGLWKIYQSPRSHYNFWLFSTSIVI